MARTTRCTNVRKQGTAGEKARLGSTLEVSVYTLGRFATVIDCVDHIRSLSDGRFLAVLVATRDDRPGKYVREVIRIIDCTKWQVARSLDLDGERSGKSIAFHPVCALLTYSTSKETGFFDTYNWRKVDLPTDLAAGADRLIFAAGGQVLVRFAGGEAQFWRAKD